VLPVGRPAPAGRLLPRPGPAVDYLRSAAHIATLESPDCDSSMKTIIAINKRRPPKPDPLFGGACARYQCHGESVS
jgi:hypothetical protein